MGFYGNTIIETTKSYSNLNIYQTSATTTGTILSPSVKEASLYITPGDPWIGLEGHDIVGGDGEILIFHTSLQQRYCGSLAPGEVDLYRNDYRLFRNVPASNIGTPAELKEEAKQYFLNNYCTVYNTPSEEKNLNLGDSFYTLIPADNNGIIIDMAGHIDNVKLVKYTLPDATNLQYPKDNWVTAMYGDPNWYLNTENQTKYLLPSTTGSPKKGLIQDLYEKIGITQETIAASEPEPGSGGEEPPETLPESADDISLDDILNLIKKVQILTYQMKNIYDPKNNRAYEDIAGEDIPSSMLSKSILSIQDCKDARDNEGENATYVDTYVIQVLKALINCDYTAEIAGRTANSLFTEIPLLGKIQSLEDIIDVVRYLFNIDYTTPQEYNGIYVQMPNVTAEEYNANPTHYYKRDENTVVQCGETEEYLESLKSKYYVKAIRGFQKIRPTPLNFENKKSLIYRKDEIIPGALVFYSLVDSWVKDTNYYLYTNFLLQPILDVFAVTSGGVTSDDLYTYLVKLNTAM